MANLKKYDIPIEPGVPNEHDYVLSGEGDEIVTSWVIQPGFEAGDIVFRIMIEHNEMFGRKGADLYHIKKITLLQALTGVCFEL